MNPIPRKFSPRLPSVGIQEGAVPADTGFILQECRELGAPVTGVSGSCVAASGDPALLCHPGGCSCPSLSLRSVRPGWFGCCRFGPLGAGRSSSPAGFPLLRADGEQGRHGQDNGANLRGSGSCVGFLWLQETLLVGITAGDTGVAIITLQILHAWMLANLGPCLLCSSSP